MSRHTYYTDVESTVYGVKITQNIELTYTYTPEEKADNESPGCPEEFDIAKLCVYNGEKFIEIPVSNLEDHEYDNLLEMAERHYKDP